MMKRISMTIAVLLLGTAASAQSGLDPVLQTLERQGYTVNAVQREQNRIRIDAQNQERARVLIYDATTGALISDTADPDRDQDRDRDQIQDPDSDQTRDQDQDRDRLDSPDQDQTQDRDRDRIN